MDLSDSSLIAQNFQNSLFLHEQARDRCMCACAVYILHRMLRYSETKIPMGTNVHELQAGF